MKNHLIVFCLAATVLFRAQTHRFVYDVEYKRDSASEVLSKDVYHLDTDGQKSKYYIRDYFTADSLISNNLPFPKDAALKDSDILIHNTGEDLYERLELLQGTVLKLSEKAKQEWQLTNEKKQMQGMTWQKALASWGGRKWTAWFVPEIPFQEGPYKFHGLPGLIVEVYDEGRNYHFTLNRTQKIAHETQNQFLDMAEEQAYPVSHEKYVETKLKYYEAPVAFLRNSSGSASSSQNFYLNDGTLVTAANSREVNRFLREQILKYNNPPELDQAIRYP